MGKVLKVLAVVVLVAVVVLAPYLLPPLLASVGISGLIATAVIATVTIAASVGLSTLLAPRPTTQTPTPSVFRQSIANSFIVYGRRRVGGLLVFFHSRKDSGEGKHYRYFVIAVAGHKCAGNETWMLNDDTVTVNGSGMVTSGPYASACWLWFQRGLPSETANATFVSECGGKWTSAHRGDGIAAIYAKFRMNDAVIEAGMPNITGIIDGKDDILDPRTATTGYTNNAALVFYDWMAMPREDGGFGAYADEIPSDLWISTQANVCDETVSSEARYALDGVITTGAAPSEVRDALVINCAGSYAFSEGVHLLRVGYWVPPSETLSEDDLAGGITVSPFDAADAAANEVQGTYYDPGDNYQAAAFSTKTTDPAPTDIRQLDLDLPFITSKTRAERIASIMLGRAQCEKTVTWPMNIMGLKTGALDVVQLDTDRYGLNNYAWVIKDWSLTPDFGVAVNVREENEDIYGEPPPVTPDVIPTIDVPDPLLSDAELQNLIRLTYPTGLTLTGQEIAGDGKIVISNHSYEWPGFGTVGPVTGTTLSGLTLDTDYYPYADIDEVADTAPAFGATAVYGDALNSAAHPLRLYLNQVVHIPALGDPDTGGAAGGGGVGGGLGDVTP